MKPPGNDRLNVFGDKTAEFYLNPKSFVEARVAKHKSSVFQQRFLNKPTIWLTDYNMVNSLLHEKCQSYDQGYDVMNILPQLFGSSCVLFQNSDIVIRLREMLARSISGQVEKLNVLLEKTKPALDAMCKAGLAQDVYQTLKEILTKLFLEFFFDIDSAREQELIRTIIELSIEHWHGIISVPTNLKLIGNTFQKALSAKKRLTDIFQERLRRPGSTPPTVFTELLSISEQTAVDHVLVCISALLPKAMASILTSTLIQIAIHRPFERCNLSLVTAESSPATATEKIDSSCGDHNSSAAATNYHSQFMDAVIRETFRLYPPFFGGRKVATSDFNLCNYEIEAEQALIYMSYFAHRDPKVFPYPEEFLPERWLDGSCGGKKAKPNLFTFGGGPRECVGIHFTQHVIREILTHILRRYEVCITEPASYYSEYKWLPVSRPLKPVKLKFIPISNSI